MLDKGKRPTQTIIEAVEEHITRGESIRQTAKRCGIARSTLWFWLNRRRRLDNETLEGKRLRLSPVPPDREIKIMKLKESQPGLSLREAASRVGPPVSLYEIRKVWKKYGLIRDKREDPLDIFVPVTPALSSALEVVRSDLAKNDLKSAARTLNRLPAIPRDRVLLDVPATRLTDRRRLDLLCLIRRDGSYRNLADRARRLSGSLMREGLLRSSIIADFYQLDALDIIGQPGRKVKVLAALAKKMAGLRDHPLRFLYCFESAFTSVYLLRIDQAFRSIAECRRCVYHLPYPHFQELFGSLLVLIGKFRNARAYYEKALARTADPGDRERIALQIARYAYAYAGDYRAGRRMLAMIRRDGRRSTRSSAFSLTDAYLHFGQGNLIEARRNFVKSLETAARGRHVNRIYAASVGLAGVSQALGQVNEARTYLRKYLPLIKKNRMHREALLLGSFIDPELELPSSLTRTAPFNLLDRLRRADESGKASDYRRAQIYADSHRIRGLFHRWIVFYPRSIRALLEKGKRPGLPQPIVNFPVFNEQIPVYRLSFLGAPLVHKNEIRLKAGFSPKEHALLIHLALRSGAPGQSVDMEGLARNFWPRVSDPAILLSHVLVRIRRKLRLPGHLLTITARSGSSRLANRGFYMTTDYAEYKSLLVQGRTLELSGEWRFAKREYLRAFSLYRGEPFRKMYDDWSETVRGEIMNEAEIETQRFVKSCQGRGDKAAARLALKKIARLFPGSPLAGVLREG